MSAAETEPVEIDDRDEITRRADRAADHFGTETAIQRYWTAISHLKKRQAREAADE